MAKPVWEWKPAKAITHLLLLLVTFPLAAVQIWILLLSTLSFSKTVEETVEWVQNPCMIFRSFS